MTEKPKNGQRKYSYIFLGRDKSYFIKHHSLKLISLKRSCFIDNIFVMLGVFQQTVGIPLGMNCASLLVDLFIYSNDVDLIQGLLKKNEKNLSRSSNFIFRYIDDVIALNNSKFCNFVDSIYPIELEVKIQLGLLHTLRYISTLTVSNG